MSEKQFLKSNNTILITNTNDVRKILIKGKVKINLDEFKLPDIESLEISNMSLEEFKAKMGA